MVISHLIFNKSWWNKHTLKRCREMWKFPRPLRPFMNQAHYGMNREYIVTQTSINHESPPKPRQWDFLPPLGAWAFNILLSFHNKDYCIGRHAQCGCVGRFRVEFCIVYDMWPVLMAAYGSRYNMWYVLIEVQPGNQYDLGSRLLMAAHLQQPLQGHSGCVYDHTLGSDIKTHIKWAVSQVIANGSSWVCMG